MNYHALHALFVRGTRWGAYETVSFNLLLTLHTALLFMVMPTESYGILGILLSCVYMIAAVATMGNDITTGIILSTIPSTRSIICTLVSHAIHAFILSAACVIMLCIRYHALFLHTYVVLFLLGISLLITEISRKSIKSILLATHHFKLVAHTEIASIILYMLFVWSLYMSGYCLTSMSLVMPLLFCSCITNGVLGSMLYRLYKKAPRGTWPPVREICRLKMRASLSGITHFLFSGNCMVPLAATFLGTTHAGGMKLASSIIQNGSAVAERTFCVTSSLLFAQTIDKNTEQNALRIVHTTMLPVLACGSLLIYGLVHTLMVYKNLTDLLPTILIYLIMQLCGIVSSTFERLLLAKQQRGLAYVHLCVVLLSGIVLYSGTYMGYRTMLISLACIRLTFLFGLIYWVYVILKTASAPTQKTPELCRASDPLIQKNPIINASVSTIPEFFAEPTQKYANDVRR
jgi:hypothetical protein